MGTAGDVSVPLESNVYHIATPSNRLCGHFLRSKRSSGLFDGSVSG